MNSEQQDQGFKIGALPYSVGPTGSSDSVTGIPCAVIGVYIWVAVAIAD